MARSWLGGNRKPEPEPEPEPRKVDTSKVEFVDASPTSTHSKYSLDKDGNPVNPVTCYCKATADHPA